MNLKQLKKEAVPLAKAFETCLGYITFKQKTAFTCMVHANGNTEFLDNRFRHVTEDSVPTEGWRPLDATLAILRGEDIESYWE